MKNKLTPTTLTLVKMKRMKKYLISHQVVSTLKKDTMKNPLEIEQKMLGLKSDKIG
jgi:hypothetical protein